MKTYLKPVMESEAFVANEFVGACWWITCHGTKKGCQADTILTTDVNQINAIKASENSQGYYMYFGDLTNSKGTVFEASKCEDTTSSDRPQWIKNIDDRYEWFVYLIYSIFGGKNDVSHQYYHPVTVSQKGTSSGPNAS